MPALSQVPHGQARHTACDSTRWRSGHSSRGCGGQRGRAAARSSGPTSTASVTCRPLASTVPIAETTATRRRSSPSPSKHRRPGGAVGHRAVERRHAGEGGGEAAGLLDRGRLRPVAGVGDDRERPAPRRAPRSRRPPRPRPAPAASSSSSARSARTPAGEAKPVEGEVRAASPPAPPAAPPRSRRAGARRRSGTPPSGTRARLRGLKRQCAAVTITVSEISVAVQKRVPATLSRPTPRNGRGLVRLEHPPLRLLRRGRAAPGQRQHGGERAQRRRTAPHAAPSAARPRPAGRPVEQLGGMHHRHRAWPSRSASCSRCCPPRSPAAPAPPASPPCAPGAPARSPAAAGCRCPPSRSRDGCRAAPPPRSPRPSSSAFGCVRTCWPCCSEQAA